MNINTSREGKILAAPSGHNSTVVVITDAGVILVLVEENHVVHTAIPSRTQAIEIQSAIAVFTAEAQRQ